MRKEFKFKNFSWVHLSAPNQSEFETIKNDFEIHSIHLNELQRTSSRARFEQYIDYSLAIINVPIYSEIKKTVVPSEIDVLIQPRKILTLTYKKSEPIDEFVNDVEDASFNLAIGEGEFLCRFFTKIFDFMLREIVHIKADIDNINEHIAQPSRDTIEKISLIKRDVLDFIKISDPQHITLKRCFNTIEGLLTKNELPFIEHLRALSSEVDAHILNCKNILDSAENTVQNMLTIRTNETIRVLTLISVFTFPLSLIAGIFSMKATHIPIVGSTDDFIIIIAMMALVALSMGYYFKRRNFF